MLKYTKSLLLLVAMVFGSFAMLPVLAVPARTQAATYPIDLWYNNDGHYGATEADVAQMLKNQLEATGMFSVTLKSTTWSNYVNQLDQMPVFLLGWFMDYPDESDYIDPFVGSGAFSLGTNYTSTTMAGYISTMLQSSDPAIRAQAEQNAQALMAKDVPVLPLFTMTKQFAAYGKNVTGVTLEPSEYLRFNTIQAGGTPSVITVGTTDSLPYLDPANVYEYWGSNMLIQMSHGLLEVPVNSTAAVPGAAQSYSISPDGLTYTFNLKPGLTFTDGTPLHVSDVIWSLQRAESYTLNGQPAFLLQNIDNKSYTPINSTAFSFKLLQKDGTTLQKLTYTNAFIWKEDNSGNVNTTAQGKPWVPIGLGPYMVKPNSWTSAEIDLQPYANYNYAAYGDKPTANTGVAVKFLTSSANLASDVKSGVIDVGFHTFTPDEINSLSSDTSINSASMATLGTRYLIINVDAVPQLAVRQAMEYTVDRSQFVTQIFNGTNQALYSMVPPGFPNACLKGSSCAFPSTNVTKAKALMAPVVASIQSASSTATPGFTYLGLLLAIPVLAYVFKKRKY